MKNVTTLYDDVYLPWKALVFHKSVNAGSDVYQETFDFDQSGRPINGHPLTKAELAELAKALAASDDIDQGYLQSNGLMPENILHVNSAVGFAVWYTPPQSVYLHFVEGLKIPDGKFHIPALVWKAGRNSLALFALKGKEKPSLKTKLFHAPFFNMYESGNVCMGTVEKKVDERCHLEKFMAHWERCFFKSRFSHAIDGHIPTTSNIVQLWRNLSGGTKRFPLTALKGTPKTLKDLISNHI